MPCAYLPEPVREGLSGRHRLGEEGEEKGEEGRRDKKLNSCGRSSPLQFRGRDTPLWLTTEGSVEIPSSNTRKATSRWGRPGAGLLSRGAEAPILVTLFVSGRKKGA